MQIHIADVMTVAMSRLLIDGETVFHGVASPMPMVAILLAQQTKAPKLNYVSIAGGVNANPDFLPVYTTTDNVLLDNCEAFITLTDIFDLSARGKLDTAFLGGVQIDQFGQTNMSVIGDFWSPKVKLPGGAGSAVVMPTAKRTILWRTKHDKKTFVQKLPFVTASGNAEYVISPRCIFKKESGFLKVWRIFDGETLNSLSEYTDFEILPSEDFSIFEPVSSEEINLLKKIDPKGARYIEFQ